MTAEKPGAAAVDLASVSRTFDTRSGRVHALADVTLHVRPGETYGIIGRSGAGKTTLLRCLNGLEHPTSGRVVIDGTDVSRLRGRALREFRRRVGMVFQQFNLLDSRDVRGNIALPLEIAKVPSATRHDRVNELIELVGLTERAHAHPAQLSGGQRQRVGIARALAGDPRLLLCDEATSALDTQTTHQILDLVQEINERTGVTVVLITHELDVIRRICDSAALLEDGRVVDSGRLEDLLDDPGSALGEAILPAQRGDSARGGSVLVTLSGEQARGPFLSAVTRELDVDLTILGGGFDTLRSGELARMRLGWSERSRPVTTEELMARLQAHGATVAAA